MAFYDNSLIVLSRIRTSFMVSDESGQSEVLFSGDGYPKYLESSKYSDYDILFEGKEEKESSPPSLEIRANFLGNHRQRSNTELKFEKYRRDTKIKSGEPKVKTVSWNSDPEEKTPEAHSVYFSQKDGIPNTTKLQSSSFFSKLSQHLSNEKNEGSLTFKENPFEYFGKFERMENPSFKKSLVIYVNKRSFKIETFASMTVYELTGLSLYKYSGSATMPLKSSRVHSYGLYIAGDDGEIETDFPPLEPKDPICKYGFTVLGIQRLPNSTSESESESDDLYITFPDGETMLINCSGNTTFEELIQKSLEAKKMSHNSRVRHVYNIEENEVPGISLDPNHLVSSRTTKNFCIVRLHSVRRHHRRQGDDCQGENDDEVKDGSGVLETKSSIHTEFSYIYQNYSNIQYVTSRLRLKVPIDLGITEEKIEIYPKKRLAHPLNFLRKVNSVSIHFDSIVDTTPLKTKGRKSTFSIVVLVDEVVTDFNDNDSPDITTAAAAANNNSSAVVVESFQTHEFECETSVAQNIYGKIIEVINLEFSRARSEYLSEKSVKKLRRRSSWNKGF